MSTAQGASQGAHEPHTPDACPPPPPPHHHLCAVIRTTHPDFFPFHYNKPDGDEVQLRFAGDVEEACSKFVYADFKVVQVEPGSHADEGFVAFSYKCARWAGRCWAGG